jgi:uncharacterized protein (DUF2235 family)
VGRPWAARRRGRWWRAGSNPESWRESDICRVIPMNRRILRQPARYPESSLLTDRSWLRRLTGEGDHRYKANMPDNIILLSDGTGNSDAALWRTNVWRLLNFIDRWQRHQIVFYDKGIGTTSLLSRIFGRAFGIGLPHNVLTLYKFLCQNYLPGSRIFAFGFSRGAYTIRVVIELVLSEGLVRSDVSDIVMNQKVEAAYRAYRAKRFKSILRLEYLPRLLRDTILAWRRGSYRPKENTFVENIQFVGLWDTVGAYGVPFESLSRGVSRLIWPFDLSTGHADPRVAQVCHALSLDDERRAFYPILWDESARANFNNAEARPSAVSQVWFAGEHSNLGGGNPDDSLAQISLYWMMSEAIKAGLSFTQYTEGGISALEQTKFAQDYEGRIHQSRQGFASLYRYAPRLVASFYQDSERPKIHESVFKRIRGRQRYAPIGLPAKYDIVSDEDPSVIFTSPETADEASLRSRAQEQIWNNVWLRSILYYLTIAALIHLLLFPIFHLRPSGSEFSPLQPISQIVMLIGAFVPSGLAQWITAYARSPGWFVVSLIALMAFTRAGKNLEAKIKDDMRAIWWKYPLGPMSSLHKALFSLRTATARFSKPYSSTFANALAINIALFFLWIALAVVNGLIFDFRDANGHFCQSTIGPTTVMLDETRAIDFNTKDFCKATGVLLEPGHRYEIRVEMMEPWSDGITTIGFKGLSASDLPPIRRIGFYLREPYKRVMSRHPFSVVARNGNIGVDEILLDPDPLRAAEPLLELFRPSHSGELFFYVNDAAFALPGLESYFYRNHLGSARISVRKR